MRAGGGPRLWLERARGGAGGEGGVGGKHLLASVALAPQKKTTNDPVHSLPPLCVPTGGVGPSAVQLPATLKATVTRGVCGNAVKPSFSHAKGHGHSWSMRQCGQAKLQPR